MPPCRLAQARAARQPDDRHETSLLIPFVSGELLRELVMEEYDGTNAKEIAIKYRCSERMVQMILNQKVKG